MAVTTPMRDCGAPVFFGYNPARHRGYRGSLIASGRQPAPPRRELFKAMAQTAEITHGPAEQTAFLGCSIKWRS